MTPLTSATVGTLAPAVAVPGYATATVTTGIVHFGVGSFHRAHEAMYVDRILSGGATDWGICGVGVLPGDRAMRDVLRAQNNLYTLVTEDPDGSTTATVVGAITDYLYAPDDPSAVLDRLADDATRIVSLTITEGGYGVDDVTGAFTPRDETTLADLADGAPWTTAPRSVLGFLTAGLRARKAAGRAPFTVMSCDNIQGNGAAARAAVRGFAERKEPELAAWIADTVAFPSSMVDRITPATTDETRRDVAARYGIDDRWPVASEGFSQWVLEDRFTAGRPQFETVGVQLVDDVEPYELMKLRLLNASHQAMSYLGLLAGLTYVHEACRDPRLRTFLTRYMSEEAVPSLRPVPGVDLPAYCADLLARFGSEAIRDTLARQVVDGSDRIPKFVLPVLRHRLAAGGSTRCCTMVLAAWSRYLDRELGAGRALLDNRAEELRAAVLAERRQPGSFLSELPTVLGDLSRDAGLRASFVEARAGVDGLLAAVG
jgi:mannitol 2-dehydrogenase